jgi:regulatory protein YycI of two-component signal transduction system YycFG
MDRKTKKLILIVVLVLVLAFVIFIVLKNRSKKKKAMIVDGILEAAEKEPSINTNKKGEPCGGAYKAQTEGATLTSPKARELGKDLVDDIWGLNVTADTDKWKSFNALATPDFIMVAREANKYVKEKGTGFTEGATSFKDLMKNEFSKSVPFMWVRDKIISRMSSLGLS